MEIFLADLATNHPLLWQYLIIPVAIILARIVDVSISTYRTILTIQGNKTLAPVLGALEALIWLIVVAAVIQSLNGWTSYVAYAIGFGLGIYFGTIANEKLSKDRVVIQLITRKSPKELITWLREHDFRFSVLKPETNEGKSFMIFLPVTQSQAEKIVPQFKEFHPNSFYTISTLKKASETDEFVKEFNPTGLNKFFAKRY